MRGVQSDQGRGSLPARRGTRSKNKRTEPEAGLGGGESASGHPGGLRGQALGSQTWQLNSERPEDWPAALPASSHLSLSPKVSSGLLKSPHGALSSSSGWAADT